MVNVIVGKGDHVKHFVIHRALLTEKSESFRSAFTDASTKTAKLPYDRAIVFSALVEWLSHDIFRTVKPLTDSSPPSDSQNIQLLAIAHLASKYTVWELLDRTTAGYVQYMRINNLLPSLQTMRYVYRNFPPDSKMRRFVARSAAFIIQSMPNDYGDGAWENADLQAAFARHEDFLLDVLDWLRNRAGAHPNDPRQADICEWHDHAARAVCPWGVRYAEEGSWEV